MEDQGRAAGAEPRDTSAATKLLAARGVKLRLAVASALILGAGALLAPRAVPTALSTPQERAAPLLEQQVQPRPVARPFQDVQDVAARVRDHGVAIPPVQPDLARTLTDFTAADDHAEAAGFGVFVSGAHVLTHASALDGRSSLQLATAAGETLAASVAAYEPATGLVLLRTEPSDRPSVPMAGDPPAAGTLAVAVGRWDGRDVSVPIFVTSVGRDRYRLGGVDASVPPGTPVYTLDGDLLAIAAGDDREGAAYPVREAANRLIARASSGERPTSFGLGLQEIAGALARAVGEKGVLIAHVVAGGPADLAGIRAGDVLLAVGNRAVSSAEEAAAALRSVEADSATLRLGRAGRVRSVAVRPAPAFDVAALARAAAREAPRGPEARMLFAPATLEGAGIPPAARVLTVNGRAVASRAEAARLIRTGSAGLVLLRQGDRQFFAAIEPAR